MQLNEIEQLERRSGHPLTPVDNSRAIVIRPTATGVGAVLRVLFVNLWHRSVLDASLMITQSFLVERDLLHVHAGAHEVLRGGPGQRADLPHWHRVPVRTGRLERADPDPRLVRDLLLRLGRCQLCLPDGQREIFPLEVRAQASAVFFAIAQCFGAVGPVSYGHLVGDGSDPTRLFIGYLNGAGVMVVGGLVELVLGVRAERRPLESVAQPLSAVSVPRVGGATATFSRGCTTRGSARQAAGVRRREPAPLLGRPWLREGRLRAP
jgi:hypothetical protein